MKPKMRISMVVLLAFALILSACANGSNTTTPENNSKGQPETKNISSEGSELAPVKLRWFVQSTANAVLPKGDADFVKKAIEEKFNVELNLEYMPIGGDYDNKLNLMLSSGDLPDFFTSTGLAAQKYVTDGIAADMTEYVTQEKMPNYFQWISPIELERYAVSGKFARAPVVFSKKLYRAYYVRQDWLDKLNLKVPTNQDEMLEVMRAFTNNDPDGNGVKDTYGMSAVGGGSGLSFDFPQWIENGLYSALIVRDNEFVDAQSDPAIQNVLQGVKDMMNEGIIDPDWFLMKGTEHHDKAIGGKVGIVAGDGMTFAFDSDPASLQNRTKAINPNAEWTPFHPYAKDGVWTEPLPSTAFMFSVDTAKKNPEKVERMVQIIDWMTSEEGFLLINYGQEGKHYSKSGSTITLTQENINNYENDIINQGNFLGVYKQFMYSNNPDPTVIGLELVDERLTDRDKGILEEILTYRLQPSIGTNVAAPEGFNLADFRKVMKEYHVKILFDEPDASNWPKYREDLMTNYGGQKMLDAYTEQVKAVGIIK
ncbi:extracellular solute-binding protein [Paenibacillus sp. JCM 10914]|uniref:extracellular solute-binding protein n=1 Tax=Paenibacillus sp. JCM 10914 TaxID=1236974 RepID=UPI0003CCB6F1|nr:extracellular solute-binding protein [Paenibacillus sp. JCM 10914]GAE06390.1 sugar ABC transporter substrate-binding protein [Paenibacillus sp. JCM 10914]